MASPLSSRSSAALPPILGGLSEIAANHALVLCDVWGVLHNGREARSAACNALLEVRKAGIPVVLITNSRHHSAMTIGQLDRLGVPRAAYDAVVTSGDIVCDCVRARPGEPVHHVGPAHCLALFEGLDVRFVGLEEAAYVVCTGLVDDRNETPDDYEERLRRMKARDLFFLCGNPDRVVHIGDELVFCAGVLADRYQALGGRVFHAGKPYEAAYEACFSHAERILGFRPAASGVLAIGDAMRTDVAGALRMGIDSLFLAGGIHSGELIGPEGIRPQALARLIGETGQCPRYVMPALAW